MLIRRFLFCCLAPMTFMSGCREGPTTPRVAKDAAEGFDIVWSSFDQQYPYFDLKQIDWNAMRERFRPRAAAARNASELNAVLLEMLGTLQDLHVALLGPAAEYVPTYVPTRPVNWDKTLWTQLVTAAGWVQVKRNIGYAVFDGIPYVAIGSWNPSDFSSADLDGILARFRDAPALIIDVRPNSGGADTLALRFAGRFVSTPVVSGYVKFRNGPGHGDFGSPIAKTIPSIGPWTYAGKVIVLSGRGVFSSAESFVATMHELSNVTIVGDTTGGASANPQPTPYFAGWQVNVSTWYATTRAGEPIESRGIAPNVVVPFDAAAGQDAVLRHALALAKAP